MQFPIDRVVQYNFPTRIRSGFGARHEIGPYLLAEGQKRPLIVTDAELAKLPIPGDLEKELNGAGLPAKIFAGVQGNPVESQVTAGVAAFRAHNADSIVALGGGAAMDVAKAITLMAHHPGKLFDYEDVPGTKPVDQTIPFFVTVPTTAGTGTEVGRSTVISDDTTHAKKIMFSPRLLARCVFADPELTLGLPARVTAATGMDALTHLVEAYLANDYHPICDGIALEGVRLVAQSLVQCTEYAKAKDPGSDDHRRVRGMMLNAAMMGGIAFQKGLGAVHSTAHPLSTVFDFHHGLANGIMIPYVMRFNAEAVPERFVTLAQAAGIANPGPDSFIHWLENLKEQLGIPRTISEAGAKKEGLEDLVRFAVLDVCHAMNPRPVSEGDFRNIYTKAFGS